MSFSLSADGFMMAVVSVSDRLASITESKKVDVLSVRSQKISIY